MGQKGEHTWDLILDYHRCPQCGFIIENRVDFEYRDGEYRKELSCDRCLHLFVVTKIMKPSFGPLIGKPQPKEIEMELVSLMADIGSKV